MQDRRLATHVLSVHKEGRAPAPADGGPQPLAPEVLRAYIAAAKTYNPHFPLELTGATRPPLTCPYPFPAADFDMQLAMQTWIPGMPTAAWKIVHRICPCAVGYCSLMTSVLQATMLW